MAVQGGWAGLRSTQEGARIFTKFSKESGADADKFWRQVVADSVFQPTETPDTVTPVRARNAGTNQVTNEDSSVTGTLTVFRNPIDPGQKVLRDANKATDELDKQIDLRVEVPGEKITTASMQLVAGDKVSIGPNSNTQPWGVMSWVATTDNGKAISTLLKKAGRGASLKIGAVWYFVSDLTFNPAGLVTGAYITRGITGAAAPVSSWSALDADKVTNSTDTLDIYGAVGMREEYSGTVTGIPFLRFTTGDQGGYIDGDYTFQFDAAPTETILTPT